MTVPCIVFWAVMLFGLASKRPILVYAFFAAGAFGTLAVIPTALTGGVTILPQPVAALFLTLWTLRRRGAAAAFVAIAINPRQLGLLSMFVVYGAVTAILLPRIFEGSVDVIAFRQTTSAPTALAPSAANITQPLYLAISLIAAVALCLLCKQERMRQVVLRAVLWSGAIVVATGLADIASAGTPVLSSFRTASYALLTDHVVVGSRRVVGLMAEASSFGPLCVTTAALIYFLRRGFAPRGGQATMMFAIVAGLLVMAALSTSSTAYVGLALFMLLAVANWAWRVFRHPTSVPRRALSADLLAVFIAAVFGGLSLILQPGLLTAAVENVNQIVFEKAGTSSFNDRMMSVQIGFNLFAQTNGWGVGVGSHSVSSWLVATLCSVGIVGSLMMAVFLTLTSLRRPADPGVESRETVTGLKLAAIISLSMASISATSPDFGLLVSAMLGALAGLSAAPGRRPVELTVEARPVRSRGGALRARVRP